MNFPVAPYFDEPGREQDRPESVWIKTKDELRLRLAIWRSSSRGTVLILPGRTEFIEKYRDAAAFLTSHGLSVAILDWRGQGMSDRLHFDRRLGHVNSFSEYQIDLSAALDALSMLDAPRPLFMLAHSMGGCIGLRALHCGLDVSASIFTAPMWGLCGLRVLAPVVPLIVGAASLLNKSTNYIPGSDRRNYMQTARPERNLLTSDADTFRRIAAQIARIPELSLGGPSWIWVKAANAEMRALARMAAPNHPSLVFLAEHEYIADNGRLRAAVSKWSSARIELVSDAWHDILQERPEIQKRCYDTILDFLARHA